MLTGEVFRIPPDGGTPELVAADVHEPVAVRFDRAGMLLVLSRGAAGIVTRIDLFGSGARALITTGVAGLDNAAIDPENRMFVSSYAGGGITELLPDGRTREITPRGLTGPYGITIDLVGTVHAADHYRIAAPHDPHGEVGTTELLTFVHGIAADGNLLHLTSQYGQVRTYDRTSRSVRTRAESLDEPLGITLDQGGGLVVAESGAGRILSLGPDDTISVLADGLGRPSDVAVDHEGRCYVSDEQQGVVYRLDEPVPAVLAQGLDNPQGLAIDGHILYVAETGQRRVIAIDVRTGDQQPVADVPVAHPIPRPQPALFAHGLPGVPRPFTGLAVAADGSLRVGAAGTILHLTPAERL